MASPYFRPIIILTAILTLSQSIAWFILSLLGVLSYRCEIGPPNTASDSKFIQLLYLYFRTESCGLPDTSGLLPGPIHFSDFADVSSNYINGWMCAYLALNISYFIIALDLFYAICRYAHDEFPARVLRLWSLNTLAFLIMDFWFTIIWGLEYKSYTDFNAEHQDILLGSFDWASSVPGALMAISARGFILYVVNLILYSYLVRYAYDWRMLSRCCHQMQEGTSRQQLHYPGNVEPDYRKGSNYPHNSIPRVNPYAFDNVSLPANYSRRGPTAHPNAVEGVTSFNDWEGNNNARYAEIHRDTRSLGRSRPPSPPKRDEEIFQGGGRPSVRSAFDYPNPRNFERGGKVDPKYPPNKAYGKANDAFY